MDKADHALLLTRRLLDLADDLDLDRDVIGMALIGAGVMLLSEVDPATAEGLAGVLAGGGLPQRNDVSEITESSPRYQLPQMFGLPRSPSAAQVKTIKRSLPRLAIARRGLTDAGAIRYNSRRSGRV